MLFCLCHALKIISVPDRVDDLFLAAVADSHVYSSASTRLYRQVSEPRQSFTICFLRRSSELLPPRSLVVEISDTDDQSFVQCLQAEGKCRVRIPESQSR